jgi:hypothetical protein
MLAEKPVDGRTGNGDLMEPLQIRADPAGTEVILLSEIQDLADDFRRRRPRRAVRGA